MTLLTTAIASVRTDYLRLEYIASADYNRFAYRDRSQAEAVRALLFDKGVAEFAPAHSRALLDSARVVGMVSCLTAEELRSARMRSAWALGRSGLFRADSELQARLALAGQALMRPAPTDFYLSRIAVDETASGRGHARTLLEHCLGAAAAAGAKRVILEVSETNERASRTESSISNVRFRPIAESRCPLTDPGAQVCDLKISREWG